MALRALPLTDSPAAGGRPRDNRAPSNAFANWLRTCGMTAEDVATKIGQAMKPRRKVSPSSVYNLRNGYFKPGRELALAIETVTKRKVKVASWSESPGRPRKGDAERKMRKAGVALRGDKSA